MDMLEQAIGQLACAIPGATRVFHQHKLDFCCGGHLSLRQAAARRGVDSTALLAELATLQDAGSETDWRQADDQQLIAHLLQRYHQVHREQLPELIRLARRVETVHGDKDECPRGLADQLTLMLQALEEHMQKEELILFPALLRGDGAAMGMPLRVMRHEHDQHGSELERMEALSNGITLPDHACNTWRALYLGLSQFREDLMQHIHLENNVLFRRAEQAA